MLYILIYGYICGVLATIAAQKLEGKLESRKRNTFIGTPKKPSLYHRALCHFGYHKWDMINTAFNFAKCAHCKITIPGFGYDKGGHEIPYGVAWKEREQELKAEFNK